MSSPKHSRTDSVDSAGRPVHNIRTVRDVPSSVSALLEACRRMEASLQMWSSSQVSESEVSDAFVTVGNEFHATMAAFAQLGIDTTEMNSFLTDLRGLLEECLSEDPTPQNVNYLMPQARRIIASLLASLRNKQPAYWSTVRRSGGSGY
ncbi:hypothetical protein SCHPADRAFT_945283 [Schizopora paradoxa]|uniref:Aip3p/Bud6 N-terminal domain-containing protein n=1 Tax=Schizopora paradoxa TaxID=27342 RepID=A0A0H2R7V9_9AGAM|nr:hypothetical protein SCHPADRAFT_945283 [Schizopora paradoxa]